MQRIDQRLSQSEFVGSTPNIEQNIDFRDWLHSDEEAAILPPTIDKRSPLSYFELQRLIATSPEKLRGVRVVVALGSEEAPELAVLLLCIIGRGGAACPLDPKLSADQFRNAIQQLKCTLAVGTERPVAGVLGGTASTLRQASSTLSPSCSVVVITVDEHTCGSFVWPPDIETNVADDVTNGHLALLLRTSGTTSTPKVVPLSHSNLKHGAESIASSLHLKRGDICLNAMPFFHIGGISCNLLAVLASGGQVICSPGFDPSDFVAQLVSIPLPTWYYAVPTMHKALILHLQSRAGLSELDFGLRLVRSGAAHLPHTDAAALADVFRCQVLPTSSMTECMPVNSTSIGYALEKPDTVGAPLGVSLRVVDEIGQVVPHDTRGEVQIRGPAVTCGYEGRDPSESFVDGWFKTGDMGRLDKDGNVFLMGRTREMVKRGGEQISLHEVDEAVTKHPAVQLCVSFAVPNTFWGEEVAAAVVIKHAATENSDDLKADIMEFASQRLEEHKMPKQLVIVREHDLPKTATGKYIRANLFSRLNVESVDTTAERVCSRLDIAASGASASTNASAAIRGVRVALSCIVFLLHVGLFQSRSLRQLQSFSIAMPAFVFLAGFQLAASIPEEILIRDWLEFIVSRISVQLPLSIFSSLWGCLVYLARCPPSQFDVCGYTWESYVQSWLGNKFFLLGYTKGNAPTWFQLVMYKFIVLLPGVDRIARRLPTRCLQSLLLMCIYCTSTRANSQYREDALFWIPTFVSGVLASHNFRLGGHQTQRARKCWGVATDLLSFALILMFWKVANDGCVVGAGQKVLCGDEGDKFWARIANTSYRCASHQSTVYRDGQCFPIIIVWVYGLAVGEGYTAKIFSWPLLADRLSPLCFGVYLIHYPLAWCWYWFVHGYEVRPWYKWMFLRTLPVSPWEVPFMIMLCFATSWALNQYVVSPIMPFVLRLTRAMTHYILRHCGIHVLGTSMHAFDNRTLAIVLTEIRKLTGTPVRADTPLATTGLDSFGATALIGVLRASFPHASTLRPASLAELGTVDALAAFLDKTPLPRGTNEPKTTKVL